MKNFLEKLIPYLALGVFLAFFIALLFILSYVLIWGLMIGFVIYGIAYLRQRFFPKKPIVSAKGRVIEHDYKEIHRDNE